jgi:hypothetical protein
MKRLFIILLITPLLVTCEKESYYPQTSFTARIAGFDNNCSTCILEFPHDIELVRNQFGGSDNNYYNAVNLYKNNLETGQEFVVRLRKTRPDEINNCITLYPAPLYRDVYVELIEEFDEVVYGVPVILRHGECLTDSRNKYYICFESVESDGRCPTGLLCFWEGSATVKFSFREYGKAPVYFELMTSLRFKTEDVISGYRIRLVSLVPYPSLYHHPGQAEYRVKIVVEKE